MIGHVLACSAFLTGAQTPELVHQTVSTAPYAQAQVRQPIFPRAIFGFDQPMAPRLNPVFAAVAEVPERPALPRLTSWAEDHDPLPVAPVLAQLIPTAVTAEAIIAEALNPAPPAESPKAEAPKPEAPKPEPAAKRGPLAPEDKLCTVNTSGASISQILHMLTEQTKANLVLMTPSDTTLTVRLTNVSLREMLRHISALAGLDWLKVGDAFVIASRDTLSTRYPKEWNQLHPPTVEVQAPPLAPPVNRTYYANYVNASQLAESLKAMFPEGLTVIAGPGQASPSLRNQQTGTATGGATVGIMEADARTGKLLILRGSEDVVAAAIEVARTVDTPRPQVSISVTIHDINDDAFRELGLSWTFGNLEFTEGPAGNRVGFGTVSRAPFNFGATVRALEMADKAKTLAEPTIQCLDGERAFVLVGSRLNFPVLQGLSAANTPIFDVREERVGIYLQVAPSISEDGTITLSLYPQVSNVFRFEQVNGGSYPQISTREAQTTLRLNSGETIVLGGLLRDEELSQVERVPLLGQIPLLGELFTRRKRVRTTSQVMISVTPTIIMPEQR
jgi:type II secretory pathway component HofQ